MNSARRVQTPKGRELETHSEDVIFEKVGREPNRFEIVFFVKLEKVSSITAFQRFGAQIKMEKGPKIDNGPVTDQ